MKHTSRFVLAFYFLVKVVHTAPESCYVTPTEKTACPAPSCYISMKYDESSKKMIYVVSGCPDRAEVERCATDGGLVTCFCNTTDCNSAASLQMQALAVYHMQHPDQSTTSAPLLSSTASTSFSTLHIGLIVAGSVLAVGGLVVTIVCCRRRSKKAMVAEGNPAPAAITVESLATTKKIKDASKDAAPVTKKTDGTQSVKSEVQQPTFVTEPYSARSQLKSTIDEDQATARSRAP